MPAWTKSFIHNGAGGAGATPRYGNFDNLTAVGTIAPAIDTLWAIPFYLPCAGTPDRIAFNLDTAGGAGNKTRIGVFSNANDTTLYPDKCMVGIDTGEIDTSATAGVRETTLTSMPVLDAGLWWFVLWQGAGTAATYKSVPVGASPTFLGVNGSLVGITGISASRTYSSSGFSALATANVFPSGGSYVTAAQPLCTLRLS